MSIFYTAQLDFDFIESLNQTHNLNLDIDEAINNATSVNSLVANLLYEAIWQVNQKFLYKLQYQNFNFLNEKRLEMLERDLNDNIYINALDSHNQLEYVCNNSFVLKELEQIETAGICISEFNI